MYLDDPKTNDRIQLDHPCFDYWDRAIVRAEKRGCFTDYEKLEATTWNHCYVGYAAKAYPIEAAKIDGWGPLRVEQAGPADPSLSFLGGVFANNVEHDNIQEARITALRIKRRVMELYGF